MDYSVILASVASAVGVLIGIMLGYVFDVKKANKKQNAEYNIFIYNEYKKVSAEIIEAVTPLTSLSLRPRGFSAEQLSAWRKEISILYFKYYTYLPQVVLNEINCLHSCLQSEGRKIFCIKQNNLIKECGKKEAIELFEDTALVGGERDRIVEMISNRSLEELSESLKINLQARRVIRVMAAIFEERTIEQWNTILKKETLLQTSFSRK